MRRNLARDTLSRLVKSAPSSASPQLQHLCSLHPPSVTFSEDKAGCAGGDEGMVLSPRPGVLGKGERPDSLARQTKAGGGARSIQGV